MDFRVKPGNYERMTVVGVERSPHLLNNPSISLRKSPAKSLAARP
jgi:hypothetical protein